MLRKRAQIICILVLALLLPVSAMAVNLEEAAKKEAQKNDAKVLSAKTVKNSQGRQHEIKLLTKQGVVKTVRVPDNNQKKRK